MVRVLYTYVAFYLLIQTRLQRFNEIKIRHEEECADEGARAQKKPWHVKLVSRVTCSLSFVTCSLSSLFDM